jgi:hypothetical protein
LVPIKRFFLLYKTIFAEEEYDIPDVDVSDIFDDNDKEGQHKKPRAPEYPSATILCQEDKDRHRKRKSEEHILDSLDGDDDNDLNKKPKAHESGKG